MKINFKSTQSTLLILVLMVSNIGFSQSPKSKKDKAPIVQVSEHLQVYRNALQMGDYGSAIVALNYHLVSNPSQVQFKDTLALLYLQTNQSIQAYSLVKQLHNEGRKSDMLTEILAVSANALNQKIEATDAYQLLYASTKNIQHGYALLQLQQQLKRVNEAQLTCNSLMADTAINQATISVPNEKTKQELKVPFRSVLLNIKGLLAYENKAYSESIESFKKALELAPDYDVAAQNLKTITAIKESMEKIKQGE